MGAAGRDAGLARRVMSSWADMRGSLRWLLAQGPSEGSLLLLALVGGLFRFGEVLARMRLGPSGGELTRDELNAALLSGVVFFALIWPIALYLLALLGHGLARAAGGAGTGRASRAATAWAALVSGPVALVATVLALVLEPWSGPAAAGAIRAVGVLAFAHALAQGFAEAHGFSRGWPVLAAIVGLALLAVGALRLAGG
jgi:hypothetical protein